MRSLPWLLVVGLACACSPKSEDDESSSQATVDLRRTFYRLEGTNEDGEYEIIDGTYFYEPGDHLFSRTYEGTGSIDGEETDRFYSWTLDADGFPLAVRAEMGGEFDHAREYVYDRSLFMGTEVHSYTEELSESALPDTSGLYQYDALGRNLTTEAYYYYSGTAQIMYYRRLRYIGQDSLLPGTGFFRLYEESTDFSQDGERTRSTQSRFNEDGLPVAYYVDEEGTGDYSLEYEIDVTQDSEGRPVSIVLTSDDPDFVPPYQYEFEYNEDGLLVASTNTEPSDEDPEILVAIRSDLTWHENPVGGIRGGKYTVYRTIDGEPYEPWLELDWTAESYKQTHFDVSGEEIMTVEIGQEMVELPDSRDGVDDLGFGGTE